MKRKRKIILLIGLFLIGLGSAAYGGAVRYVIDVETPDYSLVESDDPFEVREYPTLVFAEITPRDDRRSPVSDGFPRLTSCIFAEERSVGQIGTTAPVLQTDDGSGQSWIVRFVMPYDHSFDTLPKPAISEVRLGEVPAGRHDAIRFRGIATDALVAVNEALQHAWKRQQGLSATGPTVYA